MSKNAIQWHEKPKFPTSHFVDTRIYTDDTLFREEQDKIFNKVWIIACHESEIPNAFDYRTFYHPGGAKLFVIRGEDLKVRSFYNICPHRGNTLLYDPVGNAKRITCIFHAWSFDAKGACTDISRSKQGYHHVGMGLVGLVHHDDRIVGVHGTQQLPRQTTGTGLAIALRRARPFPRLRPCHKLPPSPAPRPPRANLHLRRVMLRPRA